MLSLLIVSFVLTGAVTAQNCSLPSGLDGNWTMGGKWDSNSNVWDFQPVTVVNNSFLALPTGIQGDKDFSCFDTENNTYLLRSPEIDVGGGLTFYYFFCMDLMTSGSTDDVVYYRIRSQPDNLAYPLRTVQTTAAADASSFASICQLPVTTPPLEFHVLLRDGFQSNIAADSCPQQLYAAFDGNFTDQMNYDQCPNGFMMSGCDWNKLSFNYSGCGGNQSTYGVTNYTCLSYVTAGNVTYTTVFTDMSNASSMQPNAFTYSCLSQMTQDDGQVSITKSAMTCGATPSVPFTANQTESCAMPATSSPPPQSTQPGSGDASAIVSSFATMLLSLAALYCFLF